MARLSLKEEENHLQKVRKREISEKERLCEREDEDFSKTASFS